MSFEHDIFISYASANGKENQATTEWSLKFCEYLTIVMNRLYEKKPVILLHDDLRVRQTMLGENIRDVFAKTAVFVTILSPEYAKSPAYLKDLDEVYKSVHQEGNNINHRIFKVLTFPATTENEFDCLKEGIEYNFFEINRYNKKAITYDLIGKNGPQDKFWSKLVDLAYDIAEILQNLSGADGLKIKSTQAPAVFLAETTFDLSENRDMLRRELQYLGFRVLPMTTIPEDAEKSKQVIDQILDQSIMTVHLLGAWYGEFLKNSKYSFIDFQIKTVKDYIASKSNSHKPYQIIWIPNDIKPTDQRQALYLKRLKRDEAQHMTEIIETPFEVFKTILNTRLNELVSPEAKPVAEKNKLYVIYEKSSGGKMAEYTSVLKAKGFDIMESNENGGDFFPLSKHIYNLLTADAVLIYKGNSTMEWLNSKIRDLVKAPGYGKSKPFRAVEIISMQKTADKSLLFLKNVPVNWDEEINHEVINHFIDHLAKK
ncbi:MAG: hypothetical protein JW830_04255 [Bacteroidales bacterium]|nr:hypothetical protein [Bacteroidales bacterium]